MSYNGSGIFSINSAGQPVAPSTTISSTTFNALTADLATGLTTALCKDGQSTPTANLPMGSKKLTGLGSGTAATDSANLGQVQNGAAINLGAVAGTNTITATAAPTLAAYATGNLFTFTAAGANTAAATLNIDGLGAKAITKNSTTALVSGDITSGAVVEVVYDGTQFQLINPTGNHVSGPATSTNVSPVFWNGTTGKIVSDGVSAGTAGQVLTSNGSAAIGSYQDSPPPWKNVLLNGGMEVWQRGAQGSASIAIAASANGYTADRWALTTGANEASTVSQQAGLTNTSRWGARVQRNAGQTGTATMFFEQPFSLDDCIRVRGKILTVSYTIRAGANFSPTSGIVTASVYCGTGAAARRAAGAYTGETIPGSTAPAMTPGGAAARVSFTTTAIPTSTTQLSLVFNWIPVGTAGALDHFEIDDVQVEIAAAVTPFDIRPFYEELLKAQFHYRKTFPMATAPAQSAGATGAPRFLPVKTAAGGAVWAWRFEIPMYASPTVTTFNPSAANANIRDVSAGTDITVAVVETVGGLTNIVGNSTMVVGNTLQVHVTAEAEI